MSGELKLDRLARIEQIVNRLTETFERDMALMNEKMQALLDALAGEEAESQVDLDGQTEANQRDEKEEL